MIEQVSTDSHTRWTGLHAPYYKFPIIDTFSTRQAGSKPMAIIYIYAYGLEAEVSYSTQRCHTDTQPPEAIGVVDMSLLQQRLAIERFLHQTIIVTREITF